jgi:hypothetical protein
MFYSVYEVLTYMKYIQVNNGKLESLYYYSGAGFKRFTWELNV